MTGSSLHCNENTATWPPPLPHTHTYWFNGKYHTTPFSLDFAAAPAVDIATLSEPDVTATSTAPSSSLGACWSIMGPWKRTRGQRERRRHTWGRKHVERGRKKKSPSSRVNLDLLNHSLTSFSQLLYKLQETSVTFGKWLKISQRSLWKEIWFLMKCNNNNFIPFLKKKAPNQQTARKTRSLVPSRDFPVT